MWPNDRFLFRVISILAKIWKTTFPKEFFNETWHMIGYYEYINIARIKIGNSYSGGILGAKHFSRTLKMHIYAN